MERFIKIQIRSKISTQFDAVESLNLLVDLYIVNDFAIYEEPDVVNSDCLSMEISSRKTSG